MELGKVLHPSLFHDTRSRSVEPPLKERWLPARYDVAQGVKHRSMGGMYHPLVRALAPPNCSGAWVRVPVACVMQWSVDACCGAGVTAIALGALLCNRRSFAQAMVEEHKFQLVVAYITLVQAAVAGAGVGLAMHFLL